MPRNETCPAGKRGRRGRALAHKQGLARNGPEPECRRIARALSPYPVTGGVNCMACAGGGPR
jgi:hypothetical protein